jgi:hypothetical protein
MEQSRLRGEAALRKERWLRRCAIEAEGGAGQRRRNVARQAANHTRLLMVEAKHAHVFKQLRKAPLAITQVRPRQEEPTGAYWRRLERIGVNWSYCKAMAGCGSKLEQIGVNWNQLDKIGVIGAKCSELERNGAS